MSNQINKTTKNKIKNKKILTEEELAREKMKYEIADELGLMDKVNELGWGGLTASETGKIGGIMNKRKKRKS